MNITSSVYPKLIKGNSRNFIFALTLLTPQYLSSLDSDPSFMLLSGVMTICIYKGFDPEFCRISDNWTELEKSNLA